MLNVEVISAAPLLPDDVIAAWTRLQHESTELRHPMLSAAFVQCMARHREHVHVSVIRSGTDIVGLFPFQKEGETTGFPVGFRLNDFQGAVISPDVVVEADWLLRQSGLRVWHFDHLIATQRSFAAGHFECEDSPFIDVSHGLEAYVAAASERLRWKSHARNERFLARDVGPVRFEFHTADTAAFQSLIEWKTRQIRQHGRRCVFDWDWVMSALEELRTTTDDACAGTLSALYAGDTLVAVHFGLRSRDVLHWWMTTYNPELGKYSPGALLLVRVIEEASRRGIRRIDLGKGNEPYKAKFQSGVTPMATGAVSSSRWGHVRQRATYLLRERVAASPLAAPARKLLYLVESRANRSGASTGRQRE